MEKIMAGQLKKHRIVSLAMEYLEDNHPEIAKLTSINIVRDEDVLAILDFCLDGERSGADVLFLVEVDGCGEEHVLTLAHQTSEEAEVYRLVNSAVSLFNSLHCNS